MAAASAVNKYVSLTMYEKNVITFWLNNRVGVTGFLSARSKQALKKA